MGDVRVALLGWVDWIDRIEGRKVVRIGDCMGIEEWGSSRFPAHSCSAAENSRSHT